MRENILAIRAQLCLSLFIAECFLSNENLVGEDFDLARKGVAIAWAWVEGQDVDTYEICSYIDGEINLPVRTIVYNEGGIENNVLSSSFLSIGLVAHYACEGAGKMATESVENFGENEWNMLFEIGSVLEKRYLEGIEKIKEFLCCMSTSGEVEGACENPISRELIFKQSELSW